MSINPRLVLSHLLTALLLVAPFSIAAKEKKPPKIFSDATEMNITLSGPWRKIQHNIKKNDLYPVQLTYTGADGQLHTIDAEVTPRGLTRRFKVCKFPPLKIHFDKEKMKGTEFRGNKSLKLVTYCQVNSKYEQYYVKESLAYLIYSQITEYSFRVQPMMVEYKDSERDSSITRFSFLIEDADEVADRNDLKKLTVGRVPHTKLDALETSYLSLFQYLIGNLDWAATSGPEKDKCCHNSKIIGKSENENPKYAIPYDFDASGLVNAHYAVPPDGLKVRNIRQRLYRGFCVNNDMLPQAVARFNEKKPDIMALFEDNTHLTDKNRKNSIKYIEEFYEILNNPKLFKREITDKCRG
jgi:hypothetical protein